MKEALGIAREHHCFGNWRNGQGIHTFNGGLANAFTTFRIERRVGAKQKLFMIKKTVGG
jgi:hypothetical protein